MRIVLVCAAAAILVLPLTGCAKVRAQTPAPTVALVVPAPPERVLVPVELTEQPAETASAPRDTPQPPASTTRARDTPARPATDRPPAATPATPAAATPEPAAPPSQTLQTMANVSVSEQKTASLIAAAQKDLDRLKVDQLSTNARAQYDSAVGYIRMAKQAISIRNYMYAEQLAGKAAAVAALLAKP